MAAISIRMATPADAEFIADLSRSTFYESFAAQNTTENMDKFMNERFTREALIREVGMKNNIFLLAYDEKNCAGYAHLREKSLPPGIESHNAIEIARIYAVSNYIGRGVGKALMKRCIAIAEEKEKEMIWLGVWEHNARAIEFYIRQGFAKFGEHIFMLGNDAQTDWLMMRSINNPSTLRQAQRSGQ